MMTEQRSEPTPEPRYKAGDVCRMADVQPYVLRYWEAEFPMLAPDRNAAGPRTYSVRDLKIIERIKKLLYDEGYTIAGAKKRLDGELKAGGIDEGAAAPPLPPPIPLRTEEREVKLSPKRVREVSDMTLGDVPFSMRDASEAADSPPIVLAPPPVPAAPPEARARRPRGRVVVEAPVETPPLFDGEETLPPSPAAGPASEETVFGSEAIEFLTQERTGETVMIPESSMPLPPAIPSAEPAKGGPQLVRPPAIVSDTRVALAVAELREILDLLARDEP